MAVRDLTVKERILLHLFDFNRYAEEYEVPLEVAQNGIAKAAGIRVHHVTQYVRPLIADQIVEERTSHVKGKPRRRKVYFLTPRGRQKAASLRRLLLAETVPFKTRTGELEKVQLSGIYQEERRESSLLALLGELDNMAYIAEVGEGPELHLVDFSQEVASAEGFLGRKEELQRVLQALEEAPLVVVTGIAGIGKSALGSRVLEELRGRSSLFWRTIRPWDTALDLAARLAGFLRAMGRTGLHSYLSGTSAKELSRIEEILTSDVAGVEAVLVLDDTHIASKDAKTFLAILYRALRQQRGTSALILSRTVPEFYRRRDVEVESSVVEVPLGALDPESSRALLRGAGVKESLAEDLMQLSGGSPLFLKILARTGSEGDIASGLNTLEAYVAEEIEPELGEDERALVEAASFYEIPVAAEGLLLEERGGIRTLHSLRRKGLLDRAGTEGWVAHDLLRSYIQSGLPVERRNTLAQKVLRWLEGVADAASQSGEHLEAIPYLENALLLAPESPQRLGLLKRLATGRSASGDYDGAVQVFRSALEEVAEPTARAMLHHDMASNLELFDQEEALKEVESGLQILPAQPSLEAAWLFYRRGTIALIQGHYERALADLERVRSWMPSLSTDIGLEGAVANRRGWIYLYHPDRLDPALAMADLQAAAKAWQAADDSRRLCLAYQGMALAEVQMGEVNRALVHLDRVIEISELNGFRGILSITKTAKAWCLSECLGDHDSAESLYRESYPLVKSVHLPFTLPRLHRTLADLYELQSRTAESRESLEYLVVNWGESMDDEETIENLASLVRQCILSGEDELATGYLERAEVLQREAGSSFSEFTLNWALGLLFASRRQKGKAEAFFRKGFDQSSRRPERQSIQRFLYTSAARWEFLLDYGRFLSTTEQLERSKEVILQAIEGFKSLGRGPRVKRAEEVLSTIGS